MWGARSSSGQTHVLRRHRGEEEPGGPAEAQARPCAPKARARWPFVGARLREGWALRLQAPGTGWAPGGGQAERQGVCPRQAGSPQVGQSGTLPLGGPRESGRQAQPESWLTESVSEATGLLWLDGRPVPRLCPSGCLQPRPCGPRQGQGGDGMRTEWGAPGASPAPAGRAGVPWGPGPPALLTLTSRVTGGAVCAPTALGPGLLASLAEVQGRWACGRGKGGPAQPVPGSPRGARSKPRAVGPQTQSAGPCQGQGSLWRHPPGQGCLGGRSGKWVALWTPPCSGPHLGPPHEVGDPGTLPWGTEGPLPPPVPLPSPAQAAPRPGEPAGRSSSSRLRALPLQEAVCVLGVEGCQ